jgi:hypothetical protein
MGWRWLVEIGDKGPAFRELKVVLWRLKTTPQQHNGRVLFQIMKAKHTNFFWL